MSASDVDTHIDPGKLDSTILAHPDGPPLRFVESYSGIRGHFGDQALLSAEAKVIALVYAYAYAANVIERWQDVGVAKGTLTLVVGRDPRPTGATLAKLQRLGFVLAGEDLGVEVKLRHLGVVTTPLIQAAVRACGADGGVIVTGSHNPIEDNGLKYLSGFVEPEEGSTNDHGAVLNGSKMGAVIGRARSLLQRIADGDHRLVDRAEMRLVYYRAPWSGTSNTYFLAAANEHLANAADAYGDLCRAARAGKQALAILVGELAARRFGLAAPSPDKMGGAFVEEFRRALVRP